MASTSGNTAPAAPVDPFEDPLYVHPSDSPSLVIAQPLLDSYNYHAWSRTIRRALESKNKLGLVDGTVKKPDEGDRKYSAWTKANNMVVSWIINSVNPSIAQSVMWIDDAKDIWKDLRLRYGNIDAFRLSDLQENFYNIKQEGLSVTEYYTKLKII